MLKYLFSSFLLALTLLLGGCGKDSGAPKLIMVTNAAFPPYEEVVDGKIDGIDPAIVRVIAHRLGYELEIQDMAFNSLIPAIASGKADIAAAGITVTEDRKKQVLFTNTYASSTQIVIVKVNSPIKKIPDLKDKRLGVQTGTTGDTFVTDSKELPAPHRYSQAPDAIQALLADKVDAVIIDIAPGMVFVNKNRDKGEKTLIALPEPLTKEEYAFAIGKHNPELLRKFNAELMKMKTSGELDEIIEFYRKRHEEKVNQQKDPATDSFIKKLGDSIYLNFIKDNRYQYLLKGFGVTMQITVMAVLLGLLIGLAVAMIRSAADMTGHLKILDFFCRIYLTVIRGTPVVVQLLIIYFVIFSSVDIDKVVVAVIAFGINSGAYVAEIIRGGIMSVDKGQMEAGRSLGLSYNQTMSYVIMLQAIKNVLPALGNEFIVLLKETSVAGYIALQDLTKAGDIIRSQTYDAFLPLLAVALIYLIVVMFLSWLLRCLEKRLKKNE